jgi:predicted phosphodiesterase
MKFGIFGDINGNLEALEAVLEDMAVKDVIKPVCTGDIVGKYANPRECLEIVRALGALTVKGNHDERASEIGEAGRSRELTEVQRAFLHALPLERVVNSFTVVHSTLDPAKRWGYVFAAPEAESSFAHQITDICFFGHTRVPHVFIRDTEVHSFFYKKIDLKPEKKYFINVGSVGEPRDDDWRAAYAIYDSDAKTVELRRLPFDIAKARAKAGGEA